MSLCVTGLPLQSYKSHDPPISALPVYLVEDFWGSKVLTSYSFCFFNWITLEIAKITTIEKEPKNMIKFENRLSFSKTLFPSSSVV